MSQVPVNCLGHMGNVVSLAYSKVCTSGYYLASACDDGQSMLRHGDTGDWVGNFATEGDAMLSVDINRDATLLATGGVDCSARIWNAIDGNHLMNVMLQSPVRSVALSKDSTLLAVGCADRQFDHTCDKILYVYNLANELVYPRVLSGLTRGVRDLVFCRDDRMVLSSSHDRTVRLWDLISDRKTHSMVLPHHAKSLELCGDGRTLTIAYGRSIVFLDVDRFEVLKKFKLPARLMSASLHPERKTFVCAGSNRVIYKCDYATGEILESFVAHDSKVRCIRYSPDGEVFATCANNGGLRLWQQNVGKTYALWGTRSDDVEDYDNISVRTI
ncbi:serine-threonine kinase receptor-associated protein [Drosophila nasuta]|uniref:serine-threonine kinase receptor-associated protein n=1 Tax=Drosophila nasuta TaxID=42062 RepID=UPI00295EA051|nr:serine-threonine kinase receptor-associated protein [Drosophila nasuta]